MATVWRCHSVLCPGLRGALKVTQIAGRESTASRFRREVDALARLRHHGVVRVLSAGQADPSHLYMVMELIEGEDLLKRLQRGPMEVPHIGRVFRDIADGLRHAHQRGIHHRDLKPANVMLTEEGGGCLVDFGIALDVDQTRLTRVGAIPGTVTYMAPEMLTSDARGVDPGPADVYSLGQVMYEAMTGKRAFDAPKDTPALVRLVRRKHARGPLDPGESIPEEYRKVVQRCTHPDWVQRPDMAGVVRLLDRARNAAEGPIDTAEEITRIRDALGDDPTTAPVSIPSDRSLSTEDEQTLICRVEDNLAAALEAQEAEYKMLSDSQNVPVNPQTTLAEPTDPGPLVPGDDESVQAFEQDALMVQIREAETQERRNRLWMGTLVVAGLVGFLLVLIAFLLLTMVVNNAAP